MENKERSCEFNRTENENGMTSFKIDATVVRTTDRVYLKNKSLYLSDLFQNHLESPRV